MLAATLAGSPVTAVPSATEDKVSAQVRSAAGQSDKITFWVTFHAKASLSVAAAKATKAERGASVRAAKVETANSSQAQVRKLLDSAGADYKWFWISNRIKVTGASKLVDIIAARPEVAKIEEDKSIKLPEPKKEPTGIPSINGVEWGVDRIGAPRVWNELGTRGEGIVVANIDTGAQFDHPALASKYRGRADNGAIDHNYNWHDPSNICPTAAPCDNHGHGSHTMGTMVGDDGGSNQIGVAPGAKWIAAKGCETNGCSEEALLSSGEWIIAPTDLNGANPRPDLAPDIVNNSWGGDGYDPFYEEIVAAWLAAGIFPAFSNGNSGPSCSTSGSPGMYEESYSSGMFDINNVIDPDSSRGAGENGDIKPNLAAPGVNVRSSVPGNGYASATGTSMASPHTAGTVALIWSASPALKGDINATRQLLDNQAIDVDNTSCGGTADDNNVYGEGRLDAFASVSNAPRGPLGSLRGTITSNGAPLAGATVLADGPIDRTTTSAADGTYSFPVLSVGDYVVTASKYGYTSATGNATVTENQTSTLDLSLTQAASATVSGTVTVDSDPVEGATVSLVGTPLTTTTNAAGFYSLTAPQGNYQLSVQSPLRCSDSVTQTLTLTADVTVNVALPERTDSFGYACGAATGGYPTVSNLVSLTGDDVGTSVPLPFPVPFYGTNYSSVFVTTNGSAVFGAQSATQVNGAIPSSGVPNGALYPMWDDLFVDALAGVYTGVVGTSPNRRFVIEWRNVRFYSDSAQRLSFVAEIGEDGSVVYRYKDVAGSSLEAGSSATIGIENAAGTVGFQYSLDQAVLTDGTAIAFRTTKHGVVRGTVTDANDNQAIAGATVDFGGPVTATTGADGGFMLQVPSGDLNLTVSKANYETKTVAVGLEPGTVEVVNASLRTAKVTATPAALEVVVPANQTRTRLITVTNAGGLGTPVAVSEVGDVPWLGASIGASSLAPGASTKLAVTVDTTGLAPGSVHTAQLKLTSQSGRSPELLVAVKLVVPGFQHAIDAGANGSHVDPQGDTWTKDLKYIAGQGCGYNGGSTTVTTNRPIAGTDDPSRFANARRGMYEYRCDGLANGTYTVELNFAEIQGLAPNKRIFDVMIEGVEVVPNLDIALEADGAYRALSRTFTVTVTDGVLNIRFVERAGFNKTLVNALRVTHRPDLAQTSTRRFG
ncbi:S8 family serine peptidase [Allorhizocola rhizosphaerae]|uniref:S8 family serine peptidase n=1 Tax=Allorhizocola rhizosphaerae TaxID=1872709 RepID=UPI001FEBCD39|nr:S8 family serine peptidase [Allorhizocola rhizosphaerae]